jgi:spore coat protein A
MRKKTFWVITMALALGLMLSAPAPRAWAQFQNQNPLLAPNSIPQWANQLPTLNVGPNPGTMETVVFPGAATQTTLFMKPFLVKMLPTGTPLPGLAAGATYDGTKVFGYRLDRATASADTYIGPVFVTARGTPTGVWYVNFLGKTDDPATPPFWAVSLDQTLHWANPNNLPMYIATGTSAPYTVMPNPDRAAATYSGPIPAIAHLHGGEQPAAVDGGPDQWYLSSAWNSTDFSTYSPQGKAYYTGEARADYAALFRYPNVQEAAPLWFHDHLLGGTRINVYAGLAGAYLLTDPNLVLPQGLTDTGLDYDPVNNPGNDISYTIPLVLQDRSFTNQGELLFTNLGINPEHPFWVPEFVGTVVCVNGKAWPNLNVEAKRYRFLMVNGSNARTYELSLKAPGGSNPPIYVIGTDGGFLDNAVPVSKLVIMPGERYQLMIDFGKFAGGTILMTNSGRTPFPKGAPPPGSTLGRVVQFTVGAAPANGDNSFNPAGNAVIRTGNNAPDNNNQKIQRLVDPATGTLAPGVNVTQYRQLTLNEVIGAGGPLEILVNNSKWNGKRQLKNTTDIPPPADPMMDPAVFTPIPDSKSDGIGNWLTELPAEGTTEVWEIINTTADAHPIHLHLVQFQLLNRQNYNVNNYLKKAYFPAFQGGFDPSTGLIVGAGVYIPSFGPPYYYSNSNNPDVFANPTVGGNPDVSPYLMGAASPPLPQEAGWKDTVVMYPGQVTRIAVRFAPQDMSKSSFAFTPNPPNPQADSADYPNFDFVWHCHIVDHEDNEMMRPYQVLPNARESSRAYKIGIDY